MRADRLLSIIHLLQVHRRLTAGDLAGRLEVSARTIHRDMDALSVAGVPVVAERGTGGGWHLLDSYRTSLTGMSKAELRTLFLARPDRLFADLGLDRAADAAALKLLAALPARQRQGAEDVRQRIYFDPAGWRQSAETVPLLPLLQEAVWQERRVRLTYQRDERVVERVVDPLGLVAKGSLWYLVAAVDGELRTYRVSRVRHAELLDEPATRPPGFDLPAFWAESTASFPTRLPRHPVRLRAAPTSLARLRSGEHYTHVEDEGAPDADGWVTITLVFQRPDAASEYLLGFGAGVEVLEPVILRAELLHAARAIVALYST